jgi:hemoglobin-like flavoprotein
MTMHKLRIVRNFFSTREKDIDALAGLTFGNMLALAPEVASMVGVDAQGYCPLFSRMLRSFIELTKKSHLWPASAETGSVLIPGLANLRERHAEAGVTPQHFVLLKQALLQALARGYTSDFTAEVRDAVVFVFDALAKTLVETRNIEETDPLRKFARVELGGEAAMASFGQFLAVPAE